jgi:hypothetical protein
LEQINLKTRTNSSLWNEYQATEECKSTREKKERIKENGKKKRNKHCEQELCRGQTTDSGTSPVELPTIEQ